MKTKSSMRMSFIMFFSITMNFQNLQEKIIEFFQTHDSDEERCEYVQRIYPDSIREWKVDDVILGYDRLDDGLHIYLGTFDNQVVSYDYSWNFVAKKLMA